MKKLFLLLVLGFGLNYQAAAERQKFFARVNPIVPSEARQTLSLDGEWEFQRDPQDVGKKEAWFKRENLEEKIRVPGAWEAQGKGSPARLIKGEGLHGTYIGFDAVYTGAAWYHKKIKIPSDWKSRRIWLKFGGIHPYGEIWFNGEYMGVHDRYHEPFQFEVTDLVKAGGEASIVVRIDNRIRSLGGVINLIHIWGGIHRSVELQATAPVFIERVILRPDPDTKRLEAEVFLNGNAAKESKLSVEVKGLGSISVDAKSGKVEVPVQKAKLWSAESPNLYEVNVKLMQGGKVLDDWNERTGFVKREVRGNDLYINDKKVFLRGYGDDSVFPKTIAPIVDREEYRRQLQRAKDFGFNYARFHTVTPPPEFFEVADEAGMMVQPEIPRTENPVSQWTSYLDGIIDNYRNHASLTAYCMANEAPHNVRDRAPLYYHAKKKDPARWAMDTDGCFIRDVRDSTDIMAILTGDLHGNLEFDMFKLPEEKLPEVYGAKPVVYHEYANVPSIPDPARAAEYSGAIRPIHLERLAQWAKEKGLEKEMKEGVYASHYLQKLRQREYMEYARTQGGLDGISFWTIADYYEFGQGLFDMLWEPRLWEAEEFRKVNDDLVIVAVLPDCVWQGSRMKLPFRVSNYREVITGADLRWSLKEGTTTVSSGEMAKIQVPMGNVTPVNSEILVPDLNRNAHLMLHAELEWTGGKISNQWDVYTFSEKTLLKQIPVPAKFEGEIKNIAEKRYSSKQSGEPQVLVSDRMTPENLEFMRNGGRMVLTTMHDLPAIPLSFSPGWWQARGDSQVGFALAEGHPALAHFPHERAAGYQFKSLVRKAVALDRFSFKATPIMYGLVHPIMEDYGFSMELRTALFEAPVGKGMLLVSGLDLASDSPESTALLDSLLRYASSEVFSNKGAPAEDAYRAFLPNINQLKVTKKVAQKRVHPDDFVEVEVNIMNGGLAALPVEFKDALPDGLTTVEPLQQKIELPGLGAYRYSYFVKGKEGSYELPPVEIQIASGESRKSDATALEINSSEKRKTPEFEKPADDGNIVFSFDDPEKPGPMDGTKFKSELIGVRKTHGISGHAMRFNKGSTIKVEGGRELQLKEPFVVDLWYYPFQPDSFLLSKGDVKTDTFKIRLHQDNTLLFFFKDAKGKMKTLRLFDESRVETDTWNHLRLEYTKENIRVILNGKKIADVPGFGELAVNDNPLVIGTGYQGLIDELRISTSGK